MGSGLRVRGVAFRVQGFGGLEAWGFAGVGFRVFGVLGLGVDGLGLLGLWVYVGRALGHFICSLIGLKRILFTNIFQQF